MNSFYKVYIADITSLYNDADYKKHYEKASSDRKTKADKLLSQKDKALSIGVWSLLRYAVSDVTEYDFDKLIFSADSNGKPYTVDNPFFFSLSHSGNYAVCAISSEPIGVDIEQEKEINEKIKQRFAKNIVEWTKKEAKGKLTGKGLFDKSEDEYVYSNKKINDCIVTACTRKNICEFEVVKI